MIQSTLKILPENCQYRGEGNSCLVIRIKSCGDDPKVIRLVKEFASCEISTNANVIKEELDDFVAAIKNIMQPLLGDVVHLPFVIPLTKDEVRIINKSVEFCRPSHRQNKVVKESDTYALVLPDYCSLLQPLSVCKTQGPTISIEIKPKQGYLRSDGFYPFQKQQISLCCFCMMQYYKLQKGIVSKRSEYCPLDLFSGCPARMHHAVKSLFHSPQNNFRIFKNEELVYSEEKPASMNSILEDFCPPKMLEIDMISMLSELVVKALLKESSCTKNHSSLKMSPFKKKLCINSSSKCAGPDCDHKLPEDCILHKILKIQLLDNLNFPELYSYYLDAKKGMQDNECKNMVGVLPRCSLPLYIGEEDPSLDESNLQFVSRKVWEFLLAMTLKDCSLMITFKRIDDNIGYDDCDVNENIINSKNGIQYIYSLGLMDLDMKRISIVEKVFRGRGNIMESYLKANKVY